MNTGKAFRSVSVSTLIAILVAILQTHFQVASASTRYPILTVTSDARPGKSYTVSLLLDDHLDVVGLHTTGDDEDTEYSVPELRANVVLAEVKGYPLVTLRAPDVDLHEGGPLTISFLKNVFKNIRGQLKLELARLGDVWAVYLPSEQGKTPVKAIFFRKNVLAGIPVGIHSVHPLPEVAKLQLQNPEYSRCKP